MNIYFTKRFLKEAASLGGSSLFLLTAMSFFFILGQKRKRASKGVASFFFYFSRCRLNFLGKQGLQCIALEVQ